MRVSATVELDVLRTVFDVAVESLDFGSGFLDADEVSALRAVAVLLNVDPMRATPRNFRCTYDPPHEWDEWEPRSRGTQRGRFCRKCGGFEIEDVA